MNKNNHSQELNRCPICGRKAIALHLVADGLDFGWEADVPHFATMTAYTA